MPHRSQAGLSLAGFMLVIVIIGLAAVLGMRVVPSVIEYAAVQKAVKAAAESGSSPREIEAAFERQRTAAYIESVTAKDLEIVETDGGYEVSVAYQKKIPLVGPASLVLDFEASNR